MAKAHPGELPSEVEQLIGDRNGQLDALKGRTWDVVIDNPTTLPVWVRDAAQILKGNVDRCVFTSTISVYQDSKTGLDEKRSAAKLRGADPYKETLESMKANGFKLTDRSKCFQKRRRRNGFQEKRSSSGLD